MTATLKPPATAEDLRRAQVEFLAGKVAARLYQRFMRANPTKEFLTLATPMIAAGILEGRKDLIEETKATYERMTKEIATLTAMNERQAQVILGQPGALLERHRKRREEMSLPGSEGGPV